MMKFILMLFLFSANAWNLSKFEPEMQKTCPPTERIRFLYDADQILSPEEVFELQQPTESFFTEDLGWNDQQILEQFEKVNLWATENFGITFGEYQGAAGTPSLDGQFIALPFNNNITTYQRTLDSREKHNHYKNNNDYDDVFEGDDYDYLFSDDDDDDYYGYEEDYGEGCDDCPRVFDGGFGIIAIGPNAVYRGDVGMDTPAKPGQVVVNGLYFFKEEDLLINFFSYIPVPMDTTQFFYTSITCIVQSPELGSGTAVGLDQSYPMEDGSVRRSIKNYLTFDGNTC